MSTRARIRTSWAALGTLAVAGVVALAGCGGEDEPPPPPKSNRPAAAAAGGARGGSAAPTEQLVAYRKVEDVVTPDEAKTIRHQWKPADFAADPSGTTNRDPFRSYIIAQVSVNPQTRPDESSTKTEKCANKKIKASSYSTRELRLIGIVSRGTIRYATFADTANLGWVVQRGDCIGSEHARVKIIGDGFVTLEKPGAPATADGAAPRESDPDFELYPKDLSTEMTSEDDGLPLPRRRRPAIPNPPEPIEGPAPPSGMNRQ